MADIWTADQLLLFLAFFVPGFISMRVYGLFIATDSPDFTKQLPEAIAYSAIHYALTGWLILLASPGLQRYIAAYIVVLVLPLFWPPIILLIRNWRYYRSRILTKRFLAFLLDAEATPWDTLFADHRARWVRIKLKSGNYIGGIYGKGSRSSTYPCPEQLYVKEQYECDATGFGARITATDGFIVNGTEIDSIEFFRKAPS